MTNDEEQAVHRSGGGQAGSNSHEPLHSADTDANLIGFARLALFISSDKEHSSSLYRGYERLAARNLLYLQSELRELEKRFNDLDREDGRLGMDGFRCAINWPYCQDDIGNRMQEHFRKRKEQIFELRNKIKEYR